MPGDYTPARLIIAAQHLRDAFGIGPSR